MSESLLRVESLAAGYGDVQILWGISLAAAPGSVTTLVGANGAGKTTTLRAVMGSIAPLKGRVWFAGEDVTRLSPHAKTARGLVLEIGVGSGLNLALYGAAVERICAIDPTPALLRLADEGHVEAQFRLGRIYENAVGVVQSISDSVHWYGLAAEAGYAPAQSRLGLIFMVEPPAPASLTAETSRLVFHVSPLSGKGLLSQQVRDALKALLKSTGGATIVDLASEQSIVEAFPAFLEAVRSGTHSSADLSHVQRYARRNQAQALAQSISKRIEAVGVHSRQESEILAGPKAVAADLKQAKNSRE